MRIGSFRKVLANRRTDSGHVAETEIVRSVLKFET
jgi:hypothetical protein